MDWEFISFPSMVALKDSKKALSCDLALLATNLSEAKDLEICRQWSHFAPAISYVCCCEEVPPQDQWIHYYQWGARDLIAMRDCKPNILARWVRFCYEAPGHSSQAEQDQNLLEILMQHIPDRIYFKDRESRFIRISEGHAKAFGLSNPRLAVGRTDFDFLQPEFAQAALEDERRILSTGEMVVGKTEFRETLSGQQYWVDTTKAPLIDQFGQVFGTFGISRDITDRVEAERALQNLNDRLTESEQRLTRALAELREAQMHLVEAEKMDTVGRLVSGIAHEVKNPLCIIRMGLEYLARKLKGSEYESVCTDMMEAIDRSTGLIQELVSFAAPHPLETRRQPIVPVIHNALKMIRNMSLERRIDLRLNFADDLPELDLDEQKFVQVLINVLLNSIQATPEGGILELAAALEETMGDEKLILRIKDNGPGIPKEILNRIFDPFYSSKPTGQGTGLGLTVSRKIVEMHGGTISLSNRKEGGVCATIQLPVPESPEEQQAT